MNKNLIKPYGDTLNDGIIQLCFTLPVKNSAKAKKAAAVYLSELNLEEIRIVHCHRIAENFTYIVAFARAIPFIDYSKVKADEAETGKLDFYKINKLIKEKLMRKIVVVGASIGCDAHSVGIDAIMNMKGYNHDYGLERYPQIDAYNLGAQITCEELVSYSVRVNADAVLVSQTVSAKDAHIGNLTQLVEILEAENLKDKFILIAGGPDISNDFACKLGYDAGFGHSTIPSSVASFIVTKLLKKKGEI